MSPASHFFFVRKQKNSADIKSVPKCCEETHLFLLSVLPEKFPDCFQTVRRSYLISLYRYLLHLSHVISHLSHVSHAISHVSHVSHAINETSHLPHRYILSSYFSRRCEGLFHSLAGLRLAESCPNSTSFLTLSTSGSPTSGPSPSHVAAGGKEAVVAWVAKAGGDGGGEDGEEGGRVVVAVGDVKDVASIVVSLGANSNTPHPATYKVGPTTPSWRSTVPTRRSGAGRS
jgi:hypothetical protein